MTPRAARSWLISASLGISATLLVFFILAPVAGYPLSFSQSIRILEIVLPVFLGYLGTAALYVFRSSAPDKEVPFRPEVAGLVNLLVKVPIAVFGLAATALIVAFALANGRNASGIGVDQLSAGMSAILGLLAVTTNVAVAYLFRNSSELAASSPVNSQ